MKILTLSCVLVYAILFASPPAHCHGLDSHAGHEDHCQGCQFTFASSAVYKKSSAPLPVYNEVDSAVARPEFHYTRTQDELLRNRAPPTLAS